jgi:superfamily II RNA helicase
MHVSRPQLPSCSFKPASKFRVSEGKAVVTWLHKRPVSAQGMMMNRADKIRSAIRRRDAVTLRKLATEAQKPEERMLFSLLANMVSRQPDLKARSLSA